MYTLHEAIRKLLEEVWPSGLSVPDIARIIRERGWYRQRDGTPLSIQQVHARVRNYERLFEVDRSTYPATIRLRTKPDAIAPTSPVKDLEPGHATRLEVLRSADETARRGKPTWRASEDWFWEGNVQAAVVKRLEAEGWAIRGTADTEARRPGVDILAARENRILAVEVKGYPSERYARGSRAGQSKSTQPTLQARHWYAEALLSAILLHSAMPDADIALAFPDFPRYRSLIDQTRSALTALGLGLYIVTRQGGAQQVLPHGKNSLAKENG